MRYQKLTLLIAIFSTVGWAGLDERLDTLEYDMQEILAQTSEGTLGANFASARPEIRNTHWYGTFAVTHWHTKLGGTEYAYSVEPNVVGNLLAPNIDGTVKYNGMGGNFGLKVGVGFKTTHDSWDLYALYTYFNGSHTTASTKPEPSALVSLSNFGLLIGSKIKSHIGVDYDTIDLELARSYFVSQKLSLRPHVSLKTAWINLDEKVVTTASFLHTLPDTTGLDYKNKGRSRFWGIGPRLGIDTKWFLGYGFHLFGDIGGSLLYGYFKTHHSEQVPPSTLPALHKGEIFEIEHKFHRSIPFAQMFMGLGWGSYLQGEKQHLGLKLGYEIQYYWRVNQIQHTEARQTNPITAAGQPFRLLLEKESEDLMFYGLTGEARLDF